MAKFAKLFELNGEQLLVKIQPSEEYDDMADITESFEMDGNVVNITLGGIVWEKAEQFLHDYTQEKANNILKNPSEWVMGIMK